MFPHTPPLAFRAQGKKATEGKIPRRNRWTWAFNLDLQLLPELATGDTVLEVI
jgi:hypothetical protein